MKDGYAKTTIRINVWMIERAQEAEVCCPMSVEHDLAVKSIINTWWGVRIVLWELHLCLEIATIVLGVWVQNYESNDPFEKTFID